MSLTHHGKCSPALQLFAINVLPSCGIRVCHLGNSYSALPRDQLVHINSSLLTSHKKSFIARDSLARNKRFSVALRWTERSDPETLRVLNLQPPIVKSGILL
ncbi:hypothetical protein RRG08_065737 [Elysia crispata]|uniref:Uncharacterized protein n=1 Tax=Elysia crispata TaxID=231223 RepID=A0AAE0Z6Q4_9GAST|nr:hypothetical protein RRG08_065737 [Elysia crispata]